MYRSRGVRRVLLALVCCAALAQALVVAEPPSDARLAGKPYDAAIDLPVPEGYTQVERCNGTINAMGKNWHIPPNVDVCERVDYYDACVAMVNCFGECTNDFIMCMKIAQRDFVKTCNDRMMGGNCDHVKKNIKDSREWFVHLFKGMNEDYCDCFREVHEPIAISW